MKNQTPSCLVKVCELNLPRHETPTPWCDCLDWCFLGKEEEEEEKDDGGKGIEKEEEGVE